YIKFKGFMHEGYFIQLKGNVQERFQNSGNWEFRIKQIQLLEDVCDTMTKGITLKMPLEGLTTEFLERFNELVADNSEANAERKCKIRFKIVDYQDRVKVEMYSKDKRIRMNSGFLKELSAFDAIDV